MNTTKGENQPMSKLPYDVKRCTSTVCSRRETCKRFVQIEADLFRVGQNCRDFIPIQRKAK